MSTSLPLCRRKPFSSDSFLGETLRPAAMIAPRTSARSVLQSAVRPLYRIQSTHSGARPTLYLGQTFERARLDCSVVFCRSYLDHYTPLEEEDRRPSQKRDISEPATKRRRGRPRKCALPDESGSLVNEDLERTKKDTQAPSRAKRRGGTIRKEMHDVAQSLELHSEGHEETQSADHSPNNTARIEACTWPHLPPASEFSEHYGPKNHRGYLGKHRFFVANRYTAKRVVDSMKLDDIVAENGGKKLTVIEAFPGPGTLTRELLQREAVGRVIALEEQKCYAEAFESLKTDPTLIDPEGRSFAEKLQLVNQSGFMWSTYTDLMQEGGLLSEQPRVDSMSFADIAKTSTLVFLAQLPNSVFGDQLHAQLITAAANGSWLYQFGRVKVVIFTPEAMAKRALTLPSENGRHKLSTLTSIFTRREILIHNDSGFRPTNQHLFPEKATAGIRSVTTSEIANDNMAGNRNNLDVCLFTFTPRLRQAQAWVSDYRADSPDLRVARGTDDEGESYTAFHHPLDKLHIEALDYLLRHLFITRTYSIGEALGSMVPGGETMLRKLVPTREYAELWQQVMGEQTSRERGYTRIKYRDPRLKYRDSKVFNEELSVFISKAQTLHGDRCDKQDAYRVGADGKTFIMPEQRVIDLTDDQWLALTQVFVRWPFRPPVLSEQPYALPSAEESSDKDIFSASA